MCGIAGKLGQRRLDDERTVQAMTAIQSHRGPDASSVKGFPGAVFGHARLSVIDLSKRALQPMESAGGKHVLVFNGEIYNYKELRHDLMPHYQFRSDSDSEVLLAAWLVWGEKCLDRLNGMFAFCVYDVEAGEAFLARDRFGQKPLHMVQKKDGLYFASEIKGLLAAGVEARPNRASWLRYLATASYDDNEETFFEGIEQLGAGRCARWSMDKGLSVKTWYRLSDKISPTNLSVEDGAEAVRERMIDLGRLHMRSDVPVGISLSGGLDSSALLACFEGAGRLHEDVKCFSVEFSGAGHLTERPWVEAAADHHGLPLQIDDYGPTDFGDDIVPLLWHSEGPLGGLMNCGRAHVMKMAREGGVTVMQDGTGLDEGFAGYRLHHNLYLGQLLHDNDPSADMAVAEYAENWGVNDQTTRHDAMAALEASQSHSIDGTVMARPEMLCEDARREVASADHPELKERSSDALKDALLDYILIRKIPRNNRFTDRMSMAYGVELRFPFLDHRFIELGLSLPNSHYFLAGRSKSIVREAMKGMMDDAVRLAPKRSVHTPQGPWLQREPLRSYVRDLIESESFASRGFFDVAHVRKSYQQFCDGAFDNSFFVWQWINLEEWFRLFIDGDSLAYK